MIFLRQFSRLVIIIFLLSVFCIGISTAQVTATDSNHSNTLLIYYARYGKNVGCFKKELPHGSPILVAQFDKEPLDVLWDTTSHLAYFVTAKGIFRKNYCANNDTIEKISGPLPPRSTQSFGEAWMDKSNGHFCISYDISSYVFDDALQKRYEKLTAGIPNSEPKWMGDEFLVYISQCDESGNWKKTEEKATVYNPYGRPEGVLRGDTAKNKNIFSTKNKLKTSTCSGSVSINGNEILDSSQYKNYFINTKVPAVEGLYRIRASTKYDIIASVTWGDTPHFTIPVYTFDKETLVLRELTILKTLPKAGSYTQIGIGLSGQFVFIVTEYKNEAPLLFNTETFKFLGRFPEASKAILMDEPRSGK